MIFWKRKEKEFTKRDLKVALHSINLREIKRVRKELKRKDKVRTLNGVVARWFNRKGYDVEGTYGSLYVPVYFVYNPSIKE